MDLASILNYLETADGLTADQAAGVAGNFQVESGLNSAAENKAEGAIGYAQWEKGRRALLKAFAAARGTSEADPKTQLEFLTSEFHGSESSAYQQLLAAPDAASAAAAFDQYYERSSGSSRDKRIAAAQAIAAGKDPSGGATSAGGSASSSSGGSIASSIGGPFGWGSAVFSIGMKVLGAAAAAGLVIVGATHTVSGN